MRTYIQQLFANASLGEYLTIGGIAFSGAGAAVVFWIRYKNRYTEIRKTFLTKINVAYHLFQDIDKCGYKPELKSDIIQLIQELGKKMKDIEHYYGDCPPEALADFYTLYTDLTSSWEKALRFRWREWCNKEPYQNGTRNWSDFDILKFYGEYRSLRGKLYDLRKQVRDSIPRKELNSISSEESTK